MYDPKITTEYSARVYDDDHGWWCQVAPDRDGLDCAELRYSDGDEGATQHSITLPWPHMVAVANAILKMAPMNKESK